MLVLTRKVDEAVIINGNIRVSLLRIEGNQVRLGFEAMRDIPILRQEIQIYNNRNAGIPNAWEAIS